MSDAEHSLLSASDSARWAACPGALAMSAGIEDEGSVYADEGSAAHELAKWCLQNRIVNYDKARPPADYIGQKIRVGKREFPVTEEMAEAVQEYIDTCMVASRHALPNARFVETKVNYAFYLEVEERLAWGTSDFIALVKTDRGVELQVHDLKYGKGVRVFAEGNSQMRLYALGALYAHSLAEDIVQVRTFIHQPRLKHVDEEVIDVLDLELWAQDMAKSAKRALAAYNALEVGLTPGLPELYPGEKQCRWCSAKANCPALDKVVAGAVLARPSEEVEFEDLTTATPVLNREGDNAGLGQRFALVELVEAWCKAVRAEVERQLIAGNPVPDPDGGEMKLVAGRAGPRNWIDEDEAALRLKAARLRNDEMYQSKLISPTTAEKIFAKNNPRIWADLQKNITQSKGAPSVARASDKRPPVSVTSTVEEFEDYGEQPPAAHPFR